MVENPADDVVGGDVFCLGFIRNDHPVTEDVWSDLLDILRGDKTASLQECVRSGSGYHVDACPR